MPDTRRRLRMYRAPGGCWSLGIQRQPHLGWALHIGPWYWTSYPQKEENDHA